MAEGVRSQSVCVCKDNKTINVKRKQTDRNYNYIIDNAVFKTTSFLVNRLFVKQKAFAKTKKYSLKIENVEALKKFAKRGFFIYANRIDGVDNEALATVVFKQKRVYFAGEDGKLFNGKLPKPVNALEEKHFSLALERLTLDGNAILFYHDENSSSAPYKYPIQFCDPSFTMSVVFNGVKDKKPSYAVFIDGPIYVDYSLNAELREENLKNNINEKILQRTINTKEKVR